MALKIAAHEVPDDILRRLRAVLPQADWCEPGADVCLLSPAAKVHESQSLPGPILALADGPEDAAAALANGASDVLRLPFSGDELRLRVERLLTDRACEDRLRHALKQLPVMVFAEDDDGGILFFNPEFERVTGYTADDVALCDEACCLLAPEAAPCGGTRPAHPWRLRAKDGTERLILWSSLSDACPIPGWRNWGVGLDISEHAREERLRREMERVVRHDMRNPVGAIVGLSEMLAEDGELPEHLLPMASHIQAAGERVLRLVDHSLALSRIERGTYRLAPEPVDMVAMAREILGELQSHAHTAGLGLELLLDGRPPEQGERLEVPGDLSLLENMAANLVKNALEASPEGGTVRVELFSGPPARLEVTDRGEAPDWLEHGAVTPYRTTKPGGTGLGLYSASLAARAHGTELRFHRREDGGSRFGVTFSGRTAA